MRGFKKFLAVIVLAVPMSFVPVKCARATAAGDVLLLAQQVLQYLQDFELGQWDVDDLSKKFDEITRIASWVSKGTSVYDTVRDVTRLVKKTEIITRKSVRFYRYVATLEDDDFEMDRIVRTTRICINNMEYIYEGVRNVVEDIASLKSSSPKEVMDATDKALVDGEKSLDLQIDNLQDEWARYADRMMSDNLKKDVRKFSAKIIS